MVEIAHHFCYRLQTNILWLVGKYRRYWIQNMNIFLICVIEFALLIQMPVYLLTFVIFWTWRQMFVLCITEWHIFAFGWIC